MLNLKDFLYNSLPEVYRREDANIAPSPYPLKRFLEVATEGGLEALVKHIEDLRNLQDIDKCPVEFLPLIAEQYGLEFPYDMDTDSQRKFIKILPKLYANKGTEEAFEYLAREVFGEGTNLTANMLQKPEDMTEEDWEKLGDWKKLAVYLEVNGETLKLDNKHLNFIRFCEIIRPVNTVVIPYLAIFYSDLYDRVNASNDNFNTEYIKELISDSFTKVVSDDFSTATMRDLYSDWYSKSSYKTSVLNGSKRLNSSFKLNSTGIIEYYFDVIKDALCEEDARKLVYEANLDTLTDSSMDSANLNVYDSDEYIVINSIELDEMTAQKLDEEVMGLIVDSYLDIRVSNYQEAILDLISVSSLDTAVNILKEDVYTVGRMLPVRTGTLLNTQATKLNSNFRTNDVPLRLSNIPY